MALSIGARKRTRHLLPKMELLYRNGRAVSLCMLGAGLRYGRKPKEILLLSYVMNGTYVFHPGSDASLVRPRTRTRTRQRQSQIQRQAPLLRTVSPQTTVARPMQFMTYEERRKLPPAPGTIRLISSSEGYPSCIARYWNLDMSLSEWISELSDIQQDYMEHTISAALYPPNYLETLQAIFVSNQRNRFLAYKVYRKWSQRVWRKRTQCNVTLIDMESVEERHALYLTDTKHHQIFRFHTNDVCKTLLSNIGSCDEMMPYPRHPTNPWTNEPLRLAQTIAICQALITTYAAKGACTPILLSAFCSSGYDIRTFRYKYTMLLSQHAIATYFAEITPENRDVIEDTMFQLLTVTGCIFSPNALHQWIQTPNTRLHRDWLSMVCDYTLYMNLHIQVRPNWYTQSYIRFDIRRLYDRSHFFREVVRPRASQTSTPVAPALVQQAPAAVAIQPTLTYIYDQNQILGLILSSELEGTLADLIQQAQAAIDEQQQQE